MWRVRALRRSPRVLLAVLLSLIATGAARPDSIPELPDLSKNVRIVDGRLAQAVYRAVLGADAWLAKPACGPLFTDFADGSGRPLADVLCVRGISGRQQLRQIYFYDGSRSELCRVGHPAALTHPGSPAVVICPRFTTVDDDPWLARAIVIHELLHTLGLGEDPPTSQAITSRVLERCLG